MEYDLLEILRTNSLRATADYAAKLVNGNPDLFDYLVEISLSEPVPTNWRAARVIFLCIQKNKELFLPYVNKVAFIYPKFKNEGMKRLFMQILSNYTKNLTEQNCDLLIETGFNFLISKQNVSLKLYTVIALYNLSERINEIKQELYDIMIYNIETGEIKNIGLFHQIFKKLATEVEK